MDRWIDGCVDGWVGWRWVEFVLGLFILAHAAWLILWPSSHASSLITSLSGFYWISWLSWCQRREGWQGKASLTSDPVACSAALVFKGYIF